MFTLISIYVTYAISKKLGFQGWELFVPGYNLWVMLKRIGVSPKWLFIFLALIIPVVGVLVVAVFAIIWEIKWVKLVSAAYGSRPVLTFFLNPIYMPIFVFKDAPYCDDPINQAVAKIFGIKKNDTPVTEVVAEVVE